MKHAIFEMKFGKAYREAAELHPDNVDIHEFFLSCPDAWTDTRRIAKEKGMYRFAIVRDPVKRLISCYRNRVIDLGDLAQTADHLTKAGLPIMPSLDTFVLHLSEYMKANRSIAHHARPQLEFLGGSLDYLDEVFAFESIPELQKRLGLSERGIELRREKSGGTPVGISQLSEEALRFALEFYREDYKFLHDFYSEATILKSYRGL